MKREMLSLLLCGAMTISMAACSVNSGSEKELASETPSSPVTESTPDSQDSLEVDQNLFDVEITVPASFLDQGTTQEDLDTIAEESGFKSVTLNDDGSATYVMTKAQHDQMMQDLQESIDTGLSDMVNTEEYPNITGISANDGYTEFTVNVASSEVSMTESFIVLGLYLYGGMYNAFNGTPAQDITVKFVNENTGDVIQEAHSSDMG